MAERDEVLCRLIVAATGAYAALQPEVLRIGNNEEYMGRVRCELRKALELAATLEKGRPLMEVFARGPLEAKALALFVDDVEWPKRTGARIHRACEELKVKTLGDLIQHSPGDFAGCNNVGRATVSAIAYTLNGMGLNWSVLHSEWKKLKTGVA